jgi:hypothetical protein
MRAEPAFAYTVTCDAGRVLSRHQVARGYLLAAVLALATCGCASASKPTSINGIRQPLRGPIIVFRHGDECEGSLATTSTCFDALGRADICMGGAPSGDTGDCFIASSAQLTDLRVNECVLAHWKPGRKTSAAPDVLISIKPVSGTAPDC